MQQSVEIDGEACERSRKSGTGWVGVSYNARATDKPYQARATLRKFYWKQGSLGYFYTAEEAAVAVAKAQREEAEEDEATYQPKKKRTRRWDAATTYVPHCTTGPEMPLP